MSAAGDWDQDGYLVFRGVDESDNSSVLLLRGFESSETVLNLQNSSPELTVGGGDLDGDALPDLAFSTRGCA